MANASIDLFVEEGVLMSVVNTGWHARLWMVVEKC